MKPLNIPTPVVHLPLPTDDLFASPGPVPTEPFTHAGAKVVHAEWDNAGIVRSRFPMRIIDFNNTQLRRFLERFHSYLDYMQTGTTEWEQILLIRDWLHRAIPRTSYGKLEKLSPRPYPKGEIPDPFVMLETAGAGLEWWCPHFSTMLSLLYTGAGFASRKVGNVTRHHPTLGALTHGVTDIFVNELGKWVQMDAHFNVHYTKNNTPLSPAEIGQEFFETGGESVDRMVGLNEERKTSNMMRTLAGNHEADQAFWNRHILNLDYFSTDGSWAPDLVLQYIQSRHDGEYCYQNEGKGCRLHIAYEKGIFQYTKRKADVYPDMNTSRIELSNSDTASGSVKVNIGTFTPNFDAMMVKVDNGIEQPRELGFKWFLHTGENHLCVRTRNKFGRFGKPSTIKVVLDRLTPKRP